MVGTFPSMGQKHWRMVIPVLDSSNMAHRGTLAMNPDGGRTKRAGRTEIEKFWDYNGRLKMSTRKHAKNSLGSMKGRVENEV